MRTEDFAEAAATETSATRLWDLAAEWLAGHGFDRILHLSVKPGEVDVRTTLGRDFEAFYKEQHYERHDPFLRYCLPAQGSIATGADYLSDYRYLSNEEAAVIRTAGETGFRAGFSLITRRDGGGCEAWNLGSTLARTEVEKIRAERSTDLRLGLMALRDRLSGAWQDPLSTRERQCLLLLGNGLRTKAIAHELGIAAVTVELHLRNARVKLGAATRDQALAIYFSRTGALPAA